MGETVLHTVIGLTCDKRGCTNRLRGPEMSTLKGMPYYHELGYAKGWRCYVNRGRRWYCPEHGPSNNHTMREFLPRSVRDGRR